MAPSFFHWEWSCQISWMAGNKGCSENCDHTIHQYLFFGSCRSEKLHFLMIYSQAAGTSPLLLYRIPLTYCCSHHSRKTASKNTIGWVILSDVFLDEIADSICLTLLMYSRRQPIVLLTILLLLWLKWPFVFSVLCFRNLLVLRSGFQIIGYLVAHGYDHPFLHTNLIIETWRRFAEREEICQSIPGL